MRNGWMILTALAIAGAAQARDGEPADQDRKVPGDDPRAPSAKAPPAMAPRSGGQVRGPSQAVPSVRDLSPGSGEQEQEVRSRQPAVPKASNKTAP